MIFLVEREKQWLERGLYWLQNYQCCEAKEIPATVDNFMQEPWTRICVYVYDETADYGEGDFVMAWINIPSFGICRYDVAPVRVKADPQRKRT